MNKVKKVSREIEVILVLKEFRVKKVLRGLKVHKD